MALFWVLTVVYVNITIFWDVISCSAVYRFHVLREIATSILEGFCTLKLEMAGSFKIFVPILQTAWHCIPETTVLVITVMRMSELR